MHTPKNKSNGDDSIEPGTPFPEPEVKPQIVSQPPSDSQVSDAEKPGIVQDSASGKTPAF